MTALSARQEKILHFLRDFLEEKGYPPTIRDIQIACQVSSTSVVDYNLKILEREGYLRRQAEVSRGIALPAGLRQNPLKVPVVGQIAAGKPIPVPAPDTWDITAGAETVAVSRELTGGRDGVYALRVKGWSMVDACISDGDLVLMQPAAVVENGEMAAVWLKAEAEVTLKKVYHEKGRVRLQPANSQMPPLYTRPSNVEIQGRVIAVIRRLI